MADKGVMIYYRAGVEDFDYDTGFVLATDYEALRKRCEAVEADAARYRWLRAENAGTHPNMPHDRLHVRITYPSKNERGFTGLMVTPDVDELDADIDQAIAAAQEPSHG